MVNVVTSQDYNVDEQYFDTDIFSLLTGLFWRTRKRLRLLWLPNFITEVAMVVQYMCFLDICNLHKRVGNVALLVKLRLYSTAQEGCRNRLGLLTHERKSLLNDGGKLERSLKYRPSHDNVSTL